MPRKRFILSGYRAVWLLAMFDLPIGSPQARRDYTHFRNSLLAHGFSMLQFSVYARFFPNLESSRAYRNQILRAMPPSGEVRLLTITDRQFGKMEVFLRGIRTPPEKPLDQLLLF